MRRGAATGFADANANAGQQQLDKIECPSGKRRHDTPNAERDGDGGTAGCPVCKTSNGQAKRDIKNHECKAGKPAEQAIGEVKFFFDRFLKDSPSSCRSMKLKT